MVFAERVLIHDTARSLPADSRSLAASLAPVLVEACGGRLGPITWFKADWQRGGAATGNSTFEVPGDGQVPVVVKLPVVQRELLWTRRLQARDGETPIVPRLYASGESLGGYDLAWVVIEQFAHGPLGLHWHDAHTERMAEAAARFHAAAARYPVDRPKRQEPWDDLLRDAQESLRINPIAAKKRWADALRAVRAQEDRIVAIWEARPGSEWLHGDLHLANAMSRVSLESGPVCLIDLAEVHAGHWVEDAIYLERQLWARPERLRKVRPVKALAAARKALVLPVGEDYPRLATVRRILLAATAPSFLKSEGHPRHLEACLDWLERSLGELR